MAKTQKFGLNQKIEPIFEDSFVKKGTMSKDFL